MDNSHDLIQDIGRNIETLRLAKGLQQKQVAEMTGISISQYRRIEEGTSKATILNLLKLANTLDVSLDMLVYGEKSETNKEPVAITDKDLLEKVQQLNTLDDKEREFAYQMLDLFLAKMKFQELADNFKIV